MGNDRRKSCALGHLDHFHRLGQRADLVELYENGISRMFLNTALEPGRIGDKDVIAHKLYTMAQPLVEQCLFFPVVFSQSIFKVDDWVFVDPPLIEIYHLT